jgi:putative SOS response-associated peptidase YedK
MINARSETAADKPAFRLAFRKRRCLILADGFYEWEKQGKRKQPYLFRLKGGEPFAFAGLWEHWERDGKVIDSCTILTTDPNELVKPLHDRMPVILSPHDFSL